MNQMKKWQNMNKMHSGRGGKRQGAGRPPVPADREKMANYTIRTYKHERPLVREFLKQLRKGNN